MPTGSQSFDAACFRLTGSLVTASNITTWAVGTADRLYKLQTAKQTGNGYYVTIRYYFQYLCAATSTVARPYAQQTSGTQLKYTGNYDGTGSIQLTFPGATNPFTISKTVSESSAFVGKPGNLTYTITITNPSSYASKVSSITDVLPAGMTYAGLHASSDVTTTNSSSVPSNGATGTLTFQGIIDQSYSIAAGGTVTLMYYATRPSGAGTFTNSAAGHFGTANTATATTNYTQYAISPLSITKVSSMVSDPVNRPGGPYAIPGALVNYMIVVGNPNSAAIDSNSVKVTDIVPSDSKMCLADLNGSGSGPVNFVDGGTSSALTYSFTALNNDADKLEFSSNNGGSWLYHPTADADGCDAAITNFRVSPSGSFAANSSFTLHARFLIK
jgi:uncharacterized repeat protein (TIGR01451 family)